jgi:hypothetical protein
VLKAVLLGCKKGGFSEQCRILRNEEFHDLYQLRMCLIHYRKTQMAEYVAKVQKYKYCTANKKLLEVFRFGIRI